METRLVLPWIFILQYLPLALEGLCDLVASFPFFDPHNRDGNSEDGYIKGVLLKNECESKKKKKRNKNYECIPWEGTDQVCCSFPSTDEYDISTHILKCSDIWNTSLFEAFKVLASQDKVKERNWLNTTEEGNRFKLELKSSVFSWEGLIAKAWFCSQAGHADQAHFFCNLLWLNMCR